MNIIENIIPKGKGIRTGQALVALKGLVVHWIGAAQPKASVIRSNFERDLCGTQYIIDWNDGSIIHCVPDDEACYHVGADSYTALKQTICGNGNPNYYFVGIECCINPNDKIYDDYSNRDKYPNLGRPSDIQYKSLIEFCADWLKKNGMTSKNLYRHFDITGKPCHIWFKNWNNEWENFKSAVDAQINGVTVKANPISEPNISAVVNADVIKTPDYWKNQNVLYLDMLFSNTVSSGIDRRINNGITDLHTAIETLQDAKIINSPEYWTDLLASNRVNYLRELIINIANRSKIILQKIVHAEACGDDEKGQILVANVIFNRCKSNLFPNEIYDVVFQDEQFSPTASDVYKKTIPSDQVKISVDKALTVDYSQGALFFCSLDSAKKPDSYHEKNLTFLFQYGGHRFYK